MSEETTTTTSTEPQPPAETPGSPVLGETTTDRTTAPRPPLGTSDHPRLLIDEISKVTALCLVFIYVCGFLITSLDDFRYGFSEMNPLRPRILAAGGWFALFLAVPFALVRQWTRHSLWKRDLSKWHKAALLLYTYYVLCNLIMVYSSYLFSFDEAKGPPAATPAAWKIALAVILILVALMLVIVFYSRLPRWLVATSIFLFLGWTIWNAYSAMFINHTFQRNAPTFWLLGAGALVYYEMRDRTWRPKLGDWPRTIVILLALLMVFATVYYPHIMSKWGGGTPLPVAITFSKDLPGHAGQTVGCSLLDETDSGFYVIGKDEKHATFIPRSEVSLIHFADANEPSVFRVQP